jgi:TatD family-associated radical SAM protein
MDASVLAYPIGNRLYLNITDRCTLRCRFCPKHNGSHEVRGHDLSLPRRPERDEIIAAIGDPSPYEEVVFCGFGEPTLRWKLLLEIADWLKARGARVRVNTDGLANLVHKRDVLPELAGRVDALSVSLNAQDEPTYDRHCDPALPGAFDAVQDFLREAPKYVPNVVATAVDGLEGVDIEACRALADRLGVAFRQRELGVVG